MADRNRFAATQGSLVLAVRDGRDPHSVAAPAPLCEIYRPPVTVVLDARMFEDVTADGQRFLLNLPTESRSSASLRTVFDGSVLVDP